MVGWGGGIFAPNATLTRAEYTGVLYNLAPDKANGRFEANFTDVPAGSWYADAAEWAVTNGIISTPDGKFEPTTPISRELMADMTYKFIYYNFTSQIINNSTSTGYADQASISDEYEASVNILTNNGLLAGRGDNMFVPQGTLTRAEAAAMASRLMDVIEKAEADNPREDPSDEPEQPPVEEPSDPDYENPPDEEEPSEPAEDPNDPANWDLDGAPDWFLVGQPDNISDEQWDELITYYADKERPSNSIIYLLLTLCQLLIEPMKN